MNAACAHAGLMKQGWQMGKPFVEEKTGALDTRKIGEAIIIALLLGIVVTGINRVFLIPEMQSEIKAMREDLDSVKRVVENMHRDLYRPRFRDDTPMLLPFDPPDPQPEPVGHIAVIDRRMMIVIGEGQPMRVVDVLQWT